MNELRNGQMHLDFAGATGLAPDAHPQTLDLHRLAAKLSEIAAELRGHDVLAGGLSTGAGHQKRPVITHQLKHSGAGRSGAQASMPAGTTGGSILAPLRPNTANPPDQRREFVSERHRRMVNAEYAREAYDIRRRRADIFGNAELFGEPAWDILLDLYIAYVEEKPVSVSSACIGSAAPPTTGLRWLGILSKNGFVLREHDPQDQRRVLVRLTERGLTAMDDYFANAGVPA